MLILILLLLCAKSIESHELINKNVDRTIDLTSQLVKLKATIILENIGSKDVNDFLILVEPDLPGNVSFISVHNSLQQELELKKQTDEGFLVELRKPLNPGHNITVHLEEIFTKALVPHPKTIKQRKSQLVQYFGNTFFFSPYNTTTQTTEIIVKNLENYSELEPIEASSDGLFYGPYKFIPSFTRSPMIIHYNNNSPFLSVTRLERTIEVSHWGNIAVEEQIEVLHTGAQLKGPYLNDLQTSQNPSSVKNFHTFLPASAHNIYYKDVIGNISTSKVRYYNNWVDLELRPRFPLFGGWRTSYTIGYSLPIYQYLYRKSSTEFVLSMRVLDHVFNDMHVEELITKVVLPAGATEEIAVKVPYDCGIESTVDYDKFLTYFGRDVIVITKTNLVEQHVQDFEIEYHWMWIMLLREPLLLFCGLYAVFGFIVACLRLDFSINKSQCDNI